MNLRKMPSLARLVDDDDVFGLHIELFENMKAVIEGCRGVLEYDESSVVLNCGEMTVKITGSELKINSPLSSVVEVTGSLVSVEYAT